jgi:hypothetical protein
MNRKLAAAAVMLAASIPLGDRVDGMAGSLKLPVTGPGRSLTARIAEGLEVRKASADMLWINILQYCGDMSFYLDHGAKLPEMAGSLTDLDPAFVPGYMFCGPMLMWNCSMPQKAAALLRKGIKYNPEEQRLQLYLAAFAYKNDIESEIAILEKLAFAADAPFMLRRILSNAYARQGKIKHAAAICRLVLETTDNAEERRWAELKIDKYSRQLGENQ